MLKNLIMSDVYVKWIFSYILGNGGLNIIFDINDKIDIL